MKEKITTEAPPAPKSLITEKQFVDKQKEWNSSFEDIAISVKHQFAPFWETSLILPYYAFIWECEPYAKLKITFFNREDKPWIKDPDGELGTFWYDIDPLQIHTVYNTIDDLCPSSEEHDGLEGFLIPLYESEEIRTTNDMNAYFRHLHFWESLIDREQFTPSVMRMMWMAVGRYAEVKEMHDIRETFKMLAHTPAEQIEPERILQLKEFFTNGSDDAADVMEKIRLSLTRLAKENKPSERVTQPDTMRENDKYRARLMMQIENLDSEIQEAVDSARLENARMQMKLSEIQRMMENTELEAIRKDEIMRLKIDELTQKKQSILEELMNHDIQ